MSQQNPDSLLNQSESELKKLQGLWKQIDCEIDGYANQVDEYGPEVYTEIIGNSFTVTRGDGAIVISGSFTLDPSQTPKAIDWTDTFGVDAGKTFPAIYFLEDDRFVFCATDPGKNRPTAFRTHRGLVMRTLKRIPQ